MKKTLLVLTAVLAGIFVVLSLLDDGEYKLQKKIFDAEQQFAEIAKDPKVIPDQKFSDVAGEYRKLIQAYPDRDQTPGLYLREAMVYALNEDFSRAREIYEQLLEKFKDARADVAATALFNMGGTYESEEDPENAVKYYRRVLRDYPETDIAISTPMYIAEFYKKLGRESDSRDAIRDAVEFYKGISENNPDSKLEFNALRVLVTAYYAQKNWKGAVETLGTILNNYPNAPYMDPKRAMLIIKSINTVSMMQLKDYDLPVKIYKTFIANNPDHALNKVLKEMIKAFEKLKDENVVVGQKPE